MNTDLLTKVFTFTEAKQILTQQITELAGRPAAASPAKSPITRFELRIEKMDLLSWLAQQKAATKIYGSDQSDNYAIAGVGQAHAVEGTDSISYPQLFQQMRSILTPKYPYLRYYGGLCFDDKNPEKEWQNFKTYKFIIPRFELATKDGKMLFACNIVVSPSVNYSEILKEINDLTYEPGDFVFRSLEASAREDIPSYEEWGDNIQHTLQALEQEHCQKIVLARKTQFHFEEALNPWLILRQLKKVTPYSYHFCFQFKEDEFFLGASPERLYKREGRKIDSEAVAGTRSRGATHKEDEKLRHELLFSEKDQREHQFVVNALNANFSTICKKFEKDPAASVLSLENGHHLVTEFHGELKEGVEDFQILKLLHPTPAVGGAPKESALQMIRTLEPFSRGWYAGPLGYVGLEQTEFVVAIRSALIKDNQLTVYAGAGIVKGSDPASEWDEVENKISNFLKVLRY